MSGHSRALPGRTRCGLLILILLLGFCVRLVRLPDKEMWYDEAFAVLYAEKDMDAIVRGTITPVEGAAADIHPLLYYFFLHSWMRIGQSPFVVRFPSVVFGLLSICLVHQIARRLFDGQIGLLAAGLTAVSPFHIWYSQETRMYSLLCLLSLLSICIFVKAYQATRWRWWVVFGLCTGLSLYAHNLAFLILLAIDLFVALRRRWNLLGRLAGAHLVALLVFLPWLLLVPGQLAKVRQAYWIPKPGPAELVRSLIAFTFNLPVPDWLLPVALFFSMLLLVVTIYRLAHLTAAREDRSTWAIQLCLSLALVPVLVMFAVSQVRPVYIERALLASALLYYVAVARAIGRDKLPRLIIVSLAPILLVLSISLWHQYNYAEFPRSPFRLANVHLCDHFREGDVIVHDNKLSFLPSHYYDRSLPQEYVGDVRGSPTDTLALPTQEVLGLLAKPDIASAVGGAQRVWFVVFQRALEEAVQLNAENVSKDWLDRRYRLEHVEAFNDLLVCLYEAP